MPTSSRPSAAMDPALVRALVRAALAALAEAVGAMEEHPILLELAMVALRAALVGLESLVGTEGEQP